MRFYYIKIMDTLVLNVSQMQIEQDQRLDRSSIGYSPSSAKLEYRAVRQSVCEIEWVSQLLSEVGIETTLPTELCCDNQTTLLHISSNPIFHEQSKHI